MPSGYQVCDLIEKLITNFQLDCLGFEPRSPMAPDYREMFYHKAMPIMPPKKQKKTMPLGFI